MSVALLILLVLTFYGVIWFFDSFFRSCMHYPYYAFLQGSGLKIGILNFSWTTTAFNRLIFRTSKNFSRVLKVWFICGKLCILWLFLPFALWTLLSFIYEQLHSSNIELKGAPEIKALFPGVNVPLRDFWVYFFAMTVCTVLHELGHAMAAAQEDVQLLSVGFHVFAIIPMAFVQFNTEHLNMLSISKRLRIFCAGVWHNLCLSSIAICLFVCTPIILSFAYKTDAGVMVSKISENSPLYHSKGLERGDIVTSINGCIVKDAADWVNCLHLSNQRFGICASADFIARNDEFHMEIMDQYNTIGCCGNDDKQSICFEYMEPKVMLSDSVLSGQYFCLKPRSMIEDGLIKCTEAEYLCPKSMHCLKPSLNEATYLIIIERTDKPPVIYLGWPYGIYHTIEVDQYLPIYFAFSLFSPTEVEKMLRYIFGLSLGIAFLNVIPCYGTDGHHIAKMLIQLIAKRLNKSNEFVSFVTMITVFIGTCITMPFLVYLFYKAASNAWF